MNLATLAIALALSAACTPALACCDEEKSGAGHEMHRKAGMADMSPAEQQKKMDEMFSAMDANKDGSISKAEFTSHHEAMMKKHREGMKMDHDRMEMDHEHMDHGKMKMEAKPASGK